MELVRVRDRGQITIPRSMREALGLGETGGMLLAYVEDGRLILEPVNRPSGDLLSIIGLLPSRGDADVREARREAQRERAERWSERHEGVNQLVRNGERAVAARRGKQGAFAVRGYVRGSHAVEQETATARDPAGVER